jgi:hypothetical protein
VENPLAAKMDVPKRTGITFVNLTQREIVWLPKDESKRLSIPSSGFVATCKTDSDVLEYMNGIPVGVYSYCGVTGVPSPKKNVIYIVSYAVLQALDGSRPDVVAPDTSQDSAVRDGRGFLRGVRRFRVM